MAEGRSPRKKPLLDVREIVLVALLASAGGVLSTYVGYIGNLINRLFGLPFGAGQLIAGLHVLWPILARALTGRFGSGTLTGLVKGAVEFLSGGTHGVVIVFISLVEGILVDLGMGISRRPSLAVTMVAGAVASASNVFLFQAIYFTGVPVAFLLVMAGLSLVSGAVCGGYLAWDLRRFLIASRIAPSFDRDEPKARSTFGRGLVGVLAVVLLLGGGVYYYTSVFDPFAAPDQARVQGAIVSPFVFRYSEWAKEAVTVTAELRGTVTYVPPREYAGVPLALVLEQARPKAGATAVEVIAEDGYTASFELAAIVGDRGVLLALEEGHLRLIGAGYDGAHWVDRVTRIAVR